jgi:hypothetical protein
MITHSVPIYDGEHGERYLRSIVFPPNYGYLSCKYSRQYSGQYSRKLPQNVPEYLKVCSLGKKSKKQ